MQRKLTPREKSKRGAGGGCEPGHVARYLDF